MADRPGRATAGFTLVEMMVALGILLVGITSVLTALGGGLQLRRTGDGRSSAELVAEDVLHRLRAAAIRRKADARSALDLELVPQQDQPVPGLPGTTWSVAFVEDETRPDVLLATVTVRWSEQGEGVQQDFRAVLPRAEPFAERVQRWRREQGTTR